MMRSRRAATALLLLSACGFDVVDFTPREPADLEVIVLGPVGQDAIDKFSSGAAARHDPKQLALTYPDDGVVLPSNVAPLSFRWSAMKPGMMMPAPDPTVYELSLISELRELRLYTTSASATVPADRWSALLSEPAVLSLSLRLRSLSPGPKADVVEADTRVLKVDGAIASGSLIFETELGLQRAQIGDASATALGLPPSLVMPCRSGHAVSADGARIGLACVGGQGAVFTLADLTVLQTLPADPTVASFGAFDPAGQRFVRARDGRLEIVAVSSSAVLQQLAPLASAAGAQLTDPTWSPDGLSIAFAYAPGTAPAGPMGGSGNTTLARVSASVAADGSEQWGEPQSLLAMAASSRQAAPAYTPDGAFLSLECSGMDPKLPAGSLCLAPASGGDATLLPGLSGKPMSASASAPTWLPSTRANQAFLVFSAPRDDGAAPTPDDASSPMAPALTNQLWLSAVDLDALPAASAISPAFWLPFQRATSDNRRALFAREP